MKFKCVCSTSCILGWEVYLSVSYTTRALDISSGFFNLFELYYCTKLLSGMCMMFSSVSSSPPYVYHIFRYKFFPSD